LKKTISGIRGIFGKDLNLKDVIEFSNNFSSLIKSQKCVIGRDTRPSGIMIQETVSAVLMKNGIDVFDLGMVPTPVVFREARKYGAGIVISSSHNPIEWNGMKFILDGRGINEKEIPQIINHQEILKSKIGKIKKIKSSYIEDAKKIIGNIENSPKIAIDIGGGAAKGFASDLLAFIMKEESSFELTVFSVLSLISVSFSVLSDLLLWSFDCSCSRLGSGVISSLVGGNVGGGVGFGVLIIT